MLEIFDKDYKVADLEIDQGAIPLHEWGKIYILQFQQYVINEQYFTTLN